MECPYNIHTLPNGRLHSPQPHVNDEEWGQYMRDQIDDIVVPQGDPGLGPMKIYSVPQSLFQVKPQSYSPWVLNMGPLAPKLRSSPINGCKALCVNQFMMRNGILALDDLVRKVAPDPQLLGYIYSGSFPAYDAESLRLLVTVDTVFLLEFLLFNNSDGTYENETSGYLYTWFHSSITNIEIWRDLLLIGNQVPILCLKNLLLRFPPKIAIASVRIRNLLAGASLDNLGVILAGTIVHFNPFFLSHDSNNDRWIQPVLTCAKLRDCGHLLDCTYVACTMDLQELEEKRPVQDCGHVQSHCAHLCCASVDEVKMEMHDPRSGQSERPPESEGQMAFRNNHLPTASQLSKAGIKFKACKGNASVIKYDKRELELHLPRLVVFDETEDVFRNLLAHEQTSEGKGYKLCEYAMVMDSLIDTPQDLAILTDAGVLENCLGSDERLVKMWNDMCIQLTLTPSSEWQRMKDDVWEHCQTRWRIWVVEFHSTYFSRPWYSVPVFVGFLLLVFTALQTGYTMKK